jgi:hypothetical protein
MIKGQSVRLPLVAGRPRRRSRLVAVSTPTIMIIRTNTRADTKPTSGAHLGKAEESYHARL